MIRPTPSRPAARIPTAAKASTPSSSSAVPSANDNAEVVERIAEGGERTLELGAWHMVCAPGDGEPRVRDLDAAARLGYAEPRMIRKLIKRIWPENMGPHCRDTVERQSTGNGASREYTVSEYWLTEAELLKVIARSGTRIADAILDDMIRVYMAVRRYLLAHPAAQVANDDGPLQLDRAAQVVNARPARPFATHGLPVLERSSTGRGAMERELLTVGEVTFTRWHADPDSRPRIARSALAATLGADPATLARVVARQRMGRPADFLPSDCAEAAEPWLTVDEVEALLPDLAELGLQSALAAVQTALPLVREHIDAATVHVRAYHRRAPGVAQASLRTLPFEVGGQRAHLLFTPRELHLAFAVEDLYHLFESLGVPTHRLAWAAGIVLRRASPRTGIWRDRVGALVGQREVVEILNLMLPEDDPLRGMAFGRTPESAQILAALDPIFEQTERLCDRCLRDGDWSVFQPRSATSVRPALEA